MPGLSTVPRTRATGPIVASCVGIVACAVLIWDALHPPKYDLESAVPRAASAPSVVRASAPEGEPELLPALVLSGRSYGPRTEPSLRAYPAPRLGSARFARRKPVAPAPHLSSRLWPLNRRSHRSRASRSRPVSNRHSSYHPSRT